MDTMIAGSVETKAPLPAPPRPRPRAGLAPHKLDSLPAHIEEHIAESVSVRRPVPLRGARSQSALDVESTLAAVARLLERAGAPAGATWHPATGLAPAKLHTVLAYIDEHVDESMGVRRLALLVYMSPFHFARMFRRAVGLPPHAYITCLRMQRAKALLAGSTLPLVEVAACVGYQTQAHFTGVFHRHVGTTPRMFRLRSQVSPAAGA